MDKSKLEQMGYTSLGKNIDDEELMVETFNESCTIYTVGGNMEVEHVFRISNAQLKQLEDIRMTSGVACLFNVGQVLETRGCSYEILSKGDEVDCNGDVNLFVKITRTAAPNKNQVKFSCVTEKWLLKWVNTHLKFPLNEEAEYYSNNGTQLFEGERYTVEGHEGVFKCTKRGGIRLMRENGALSLSFIDIVEKDYTVVPY